jgi:hypothetical protein
MKLTPEAVTLFNALAQALGGQVGQVQVQYATRTKKPSTRQASRPKAEPKPKAKKVVPAFIALRAANKAENKVLADALREVGLPTSGKPWDDAKKRLETLYADAETIGAEPTREELCTLAARWAKKQQA